MVEFTAAKIQKTREEECWCVLVFRDVQDEFLMEQQRGLENSQLATAAQIAYQMLISVNLTQNTYHMLQYDRNTVQKPGEAGCFNDLIERELSTVHPDYREEFFGKFSRQSLIDVYSHGKRIVTMEVPHLGEDGEYHWYFTQVVRVESPYTDDLIEITLSRNIDEERRVQRETLEKERRAKQLLEDALQKVEKASQAKSDFLSRMSHDIRTPMNAILGMTELARLHPGEEEKLQDYLEKIDTSGQHLLSLINEVLDMSKIESGRIVLSEEDFLLDSLFKDVISMIQPDLKRRGHTLNIHIETLEHEAVCGDMQRLQQIINNLLSNAIKYTPHGGTITLELSEARSPQQGYGTYRLVCEDNGVGISPEFIERVFEPL